MLNAPLVYCCSIACDVFSFRFAPQLFEEKCFSLLLLFFPAARLHRWGKKNDINGPGASSNLGFIALHRCVCAGGGGGLGGRVLLWMSAGGS